MWLEQVFVAQQEDADVWSPPQLIDMLQHFRICSGICVCFRSEALWHAAAPVSTAQGMGVGRGSRSCLAALEFGQKRGEDIAHNDNDGMEAFEIALGTGSVARHLADVKLIGVHLDDEHIVAEALTGKSILRIKDRLRFVAGQVMQRERDVLR